MALTVQQISAKVKYLERRGGDKDNRNSKVLAVRQGRINQVFPDFFPPDVDTAVVANFTDIVARDLSEVMAPLPAINCSAGNSVTSKAREFADTRTRIAANYLIHSSLIAHQYVFADRYLTYGFSAYVVELDDDAKLPRIRVEDTFLSYPEFDRFGRVVSFTKRYIMSLGDIIAQYPEHEMELRKKTRGSRSTTGGQEGLDSMVDLYRYYDKDQSIILVPSRNDLVLSQAKNPIGKMMVVVAKRPSLDEEMRGQFDDVLGIQMLRNRFAMLAVEALEKSIQSPTVVPTDVQDMQFGADAIIRTNNPAGVRRVDLQVPQGAFLESANLSQEMQTGARYPQSRTGNVNASVITGQGVQALMGAFDTQVKSFQAIVSNALRELIEICFEVDEKIYDKKKTIRGVDAGAPYSIDYTPSKDIAGDYSVEVRYGILAGLNPAQGLVFLLQASQAGWMSDDMAMRELPFSVNVTVEQEKIETEKMRKSLLSSIEQLTQAIPQMIAQGQDPSQLITNIADTILARQKGEVIEEAMKRIFAPVPPPATPEIPGTPPDQGAAPSADAVGQTQSDQGGQAPGGPMIKPPPAPPVDIQSILTHIADNGKMGARATTTHASS